MATRLWQIISVNGIVYALTQEGQILMTVSGSNTATTIATAPPSGRGDGLIGLGDHLLVNATGSSTLPGTLYALQVDGSLLPLGPGSDYVSPYGASGTAILDNKLYYFGEDPVTGYTALFTTDGTPSGTMLITDTGTSTAEAQYVAAINGRVYFILGGQIWSSDGTAGGTTPLGPTSAAGTPVAFNGAVFFMTSDQANGTRLWSTDGTPAGTTVAKTLDTGGNIVPTACHLIVFAGQLYVQTPTQFWTGDGTANGMQPVPGIEPIGADGGDAFLGISGGRLFVSAYTPLYGTELWAFDAPGTISGYVFNDANHNASREPAEPGMSGVTVYLDANNNGRLDPGETSTLTDSQGNYTFYNLPTSNYTIREVLPAGYALTAPLGSSQTLAVSSTQTVRGPVFGNVLISSVTMDLSYFLTVARNFGQAGTFASGDLNGDGTVNLADLLLLVRNFGHALPTPPLAPSAIPSSTIPGASAPRRVRRV